MSQTNIAITQLAQLGLAERIVQETQGHPEVLKQAAQQATPEELKKLRHAVAGTEDTAKSRGVKAEKDGGRSGGNAGTMRDGKRKGDEDENASSSESPWAGNILNLKV